MQLACNTHLCRYRQSLHFVNKMRVHERLRHMVVCPMLQVDVTEAWLTFSSIVLAFSFIFANSIRTVFECVVFLFVVHPFDVGDTVVLEGQHCKVGVALQ